MGMKNFSGNRNESLAKKLTRKQTFQKISTPRGKQGVTPRGQKATVVADDSENDDYGDEYGNEEDQYGEEEIEDELFDDLYSQQNFEVYGILMDPLKCELDEYLNKDEKYNFRFTNPMIEAAA